MPVFAPTPYQAMGCTRRGTGCVEKPVGLPLGQCRHNGSSQGARRQQPLRRGMRIRAAGHHDLFQVVGTALCLRFPCSLCAHRFQRVCAHAPPCARTAFSGCARNVGRHVAQDDVAPASVLRDAGDPPRPVAVVVPPQNDVPAVDELPQA